MKFVRAKHMILTVAAIFSLLVSAVSACACSHHEPAKVEVSSCHSSSHEAPPVETSNDPAHFESGCNCFVRIPVRAVVAKKDDKRPDAEEPVADITAVAQRTVVVDDQAVSDVSFEPPQSNYQHALLASLPSRAPPRL